jgi:hypothetical protein
MNRGNLQKIYLVEKRAVMKSSATRVREEKKG